LHGRWPRNKRWEARTAHQIPEISFQPAAISAEPPLGRRLL
jgi:hypothetical protein